MANIWMHNGFLQVEGEKMSKILGNFFTIREVLADWQGDVIRLGNAVNALPPADQLDREGTGGGREGARELLRCGFGADAEARPAPGVLEALADDLNTPQAITEMHALRNAGGRKALAGTLAFFGFRAGRLLGMARARVHRRRRSRRAEIDRRIAARLDARKAKNFAEADRIRDELAALGVVLKDSKDGTTWELAR